MIFRPDALVRPGWLLLVAVVLPLLAGCTSDKSAPQRDSDRQVSHREGDRDASFPQAGYGPKVRLCDDDGLPEDFAFPPEVVAVLGDRRSAHWHERTKSAGFSPDGRFFLTRGSDYSVASPLKLWDLHTVKIVREFEKCSRGSLSHFVSQSACPDEFLEFTPDARLLAWLAGTEHVGYAQTEDHHVYGTARFWDGRAVREVKWEQWVRDPRALHISPDGSRLAIIGEIEESLLDGLTLLDVRSGEVLLSEGDDIDGPMRFFGFSPDGRFLATSGKGPSAALHDARTGKQLHAFQDCSALAFHPYDATLAWAATDGPVYLAELPGGKLVHRLAGHEVRADMLVFDTTGHTLASGSLQHRREYEVNKEVRLWDTATGTQTHVLRPKISRADSLETFGKFTFSPDGRRCTLAVPGESISVWKVASGERLWEADLREELVTFDSSVWACASVVFSPDGQTVLLGSCFPNATSSPGGTLVRIWDAATGAERPRFWPDEPIESVTLSPDGRTLVVEGKYSGVSVWDFASGKERLPTDGHRAPVTDLCFSPDGKTLASASWDRSIKLWDLSLQEPKRTLIGHADVVTCVAFSPGGGTLVTGSSDGTVKFWEVASGKLLRTVADESGGYYGKFVAHDLSFRANGATLAVSGVQ